MNAAWLGKRVVINIRHIAYGTGSVYYGYKEGVVVAETDEMVKVRGLVLKRWHWKQACSVIDESPHTK